MQVALDKNSNVSVRQQLITQIELLIATQELKPDEFLPSVTQLGRLLKIHRNTVAQVYNDLVRAGFLVGRRGTRLAVRKLDRPFPKGSGTGLDKVINDAIAAANKTGYSLLDFRSHVLQRFSNDLPASVLLVAVEARMGELVQAELTEVLPYRIQTCLWSEFALNPGMAVGALVVSTPAIAPELAGLIEQVAPLAVLRYNSTSDVTELILQLSRPSVIGLVSVSQYVLDFARLVFAPVLGNRHSIAEYLLNEGEPLSVGCADLIVCDSLVHSRLSARDQKKVIPYRIVSKDCVENIQSMMRKSPSSGTLRE